MSTSCGACGKLLRYSQAVLKCSGIGCKTMAHYRCVASSTTQDWRCVGCCYPTEVSVQFLLGEILKKGSGLELLQGLISKINDLVTDINKIRDENETIKKEITLLTNNNNGRKVINFTGSSSSLFCAQSTTKSTSLMNNEINQIPVANIDLISTEDDTKHGISVPCTSTTTGPTGFSMEHTAHRIEEEIVKLAAAPRKVSIFVTWPNTSQGETYLQHYLQNATQVLSFECVRVSCYDNFSMFQIKVDQTLAHLFANPHIYPEGCKIDVFGR